MKFIHPRSTQDGTPVPNSGKKSHLILDYVLSDNGFYSPLLGQPYQILPYGSPWTDENLQMVIDNDDGSDYVFVVAILCDCCQKLTFQMITSDQRRVTCKNVVRKRIYAFDATDDRNDETTKQQNSRLKQKNVRACTDRNRS